MDEENEHNSSASTYQDGGLRVKGEDLHDRCSCAAKEGCHSISASFRPVVKREIAYPKQVANNRILVSECDVGISVVLNETTDRSQYQ